MRNSKAAIAIRKTHRYLGLFLGVQFLIWTISGIYFSWTNIDEIHGDQFRRSEVPLSTFRGLVSPSSLDRGGIRTLELREIGGQPYYFINGKTLIHARTGERHPELTAGEAVDVASRHMAGDLKVTSVERITKTDGKHEYRDRPLPAFVVNYQHPDNIKAYVSAIDGSFQTVRHRSWRWYDFLWMTHTMDYQGRDNINTNLLRAFSLLGFITVLSGFALWFISSSYIRKALKKVRPVRRFYRSP